MIRMALKQKTASHNNIFFSEFCIEISVGVLMAQCAITMWRSCTATRSKRAFRCYNTVSIKRQILYNNNIFTHILYWSCYTFTFTIIIVVVIYPKPKLRRDWFWRFKTTRTSRQEKKNTKSVTYYTVKYCKHSFYRKMYLSSIWCKYRYLMLMSKCKSLVG